MAQNWWWQDRHRQAGRKAGTWHPPGSLWPQESASCSLPQWGSHQQSQKNSGVPGEWAYNVAHFTCCLWAYTTSGELLRDASKSARRLLATEVLKLSLENNVVTPLTSLVMVQPKEASGKVRSQISTAAVLGTIMPSSASRRGLGTGTAPSALLPKVSPKLGLVKPRSYLSPMAPASTEIMSSSKELEPLGQDTKYPIHPSTPQIPKSYTTGFRHFGSANSQNKNCYLWPSNSGALLLLKPSVPSHQNPGTLLPMTAKTQVPLLNPSTPSQPKAGIVKHDIPLSSKPGVPSQPKLDALSHSQLGILTSQSPKSLPQANPGVSMLQVFKHLSQN